MLARPLTNLTASETEILSAMVDRLIPSDELGPGALDAGVIRYIDRALSEAESDTADAYRSRPGGSRHLQPVTREGGRSSTSPRSIRTRCSSTSRLGRRPVPGVGFVGGSGSFFNMVKSHTWQGMFGDPEYGGNVNFAGWDLLDYPGVRLAVSPEDQRRLEADQLAPVRRSAYDYPMFE